jgi:hypothetical protein
MQIGEATYAVTIPDDGRLTFDLCLSRAINILGA